MTEERRQQPRYAVQLPVEIYVGRESVLPSVRGTTRDVSMTGAFAVTAEQPAEDEVVVYFGLDEVKWSTPARVVRKDNGGWGLIFLQPRDGFLRALNARLSRVAVA